MTEEKAKSEAVHRGNHSSQYPSLMIGYCLLLAGRKGNGKTQAISINIKVEKNKAKFKINTLLRPGQVQPIIYIGQASRPRRTDICRVGVTWVTKSHGSSPGTTTHHQLAAEVVDAERVEKVGM